MALALALLIFGAYRSPSRLRSGCAGVLLLAGVLLTAASLVGVRAYGDTADARAVIVARAGILRSIPTEADTSQKTSTLSAGSIAVIDKTYLRWVRLSFDNGQTGWVLKDDVVGLWK